MNTKDQENSAVLLKSILEDLVESVKLSDGYGNCLNEYSSLTEIKQNYLTKEKKLSDDLEKILKTYYEKEKIEIFLPYKSKISSFLDSTLGDYLSSLMADIDKQISNKQRECDGYVQKIKTILQNFLLNDPFVIDSSEIVCRFSDGKYGAEQTINCKNNIDYQYSLDTSQVEFLRNKSTGSKLSKGLRIPVRAGKKWLSKKVALDFEKFDPYYLNRATLTQDLLTLEFQNDEMASKIIIESAQTIKKDLKVFYKDEVQSVEITGNQDLLSGLNLDAIHSIANQLELGINFISKYRLALLSLKVKNIEILTSMKAFDFLYAGCQNLSKQLSPLVVGILSGAEIPGTDENSTVTKDYINQRLSLLGQRSSLISPLLGVPSVSIIKNTKKKKHDGPLNLK
ncbi:MAG: hypothetical protein LVQ96_03665 [Thermoplasmatales archaeon]|nr:hypothetical protein [Thermoplasmatales archaeon]MCW6170249.1 hypothetical protein [Thermoplasmatales archaeon]